MRWFSFALVALIPAGVRAAPPLAVGFSEVDVSPVLGTKPVYMAGFGHNRKATSVHDPIMVRAVVLSDGTKTIAWACVDVVGLFHAHAESIRGRLTGFDHVLVAATHNHEGPDTLGLWGSSPLSSGVDRDYLTRVEDGVVRAIEAARKALAPAVAEIGTAAGPDLINDNRLPVVKHDELVVLRFVPPGGGKPLGIVVQWNCHPEMLNDRNHAVTADFVGTTVATLKTRHGCPVAYFNGTVGGLMTCLGLVIKGPNGLPLADGTFEKAEEYGRQVADLADTALAAVQPVTLTPFDVRTRSVLIPVENGLYKLGWQIGTLKRTLYRWDGDPTPTTPQETRDSTKPVAVRTEVGLMVLGELSVVAMPGEVYPEVVLGRVQTPVDPAADFPNAPAESGLYPALKTKRRMIIGLANDEIGYIIPKRQWDELPPYCYGLKKSQYGEINSVGPDAAPIITDVFRKLAGH
jgi:hypothetical protein